MRRIDCQNLNDKHGKIKTQSKIKCNLSFSEIHGEQPLFQSFPWFSAYSDFSDTHNQNLTRFSQNLVFHLNIPLLESQCFQIPRLRFFKKKLIKPIQLRRVIS